MPGDREAPLQLVDGAELYGGYAGLANPGFEPGPPNAAPARKNHSTA